MATIREKRPGLSEVRVFTGSDALGRLGHANPATALRVYAHAFADQAVAAGFGGILRSADK
jgi:hypothetical protein